MFIDYSIRQLNKDNQILCGDNVEVIKNKDNTIIVLSDGLGSGVKANISSTYTKIIISKMLSNGSDLESIINTLSKTLPTCQTRNIAYSTFTVVQIFKDLRIKVIEFGNPGIFYIHKGKNKPYESKLVELSGKEINISEFKLHKDDYLVIASDGLVHAGRGGQEHAGLLHAGWGRNKVAEFIEASLKENGEPEILAEKLVYYAELLEQGRVCDDISVVAVRIREPRILNIAVGPPAIKNKDEEMSRAFVNTSGKKIVCGGTTSKIIAKAMNTKVRTVVSRGNLPSKVEIQGIDLATEGLITLTRAVDIIENLNTYTNRRKNQVELHNIYSIYRKRDIFNELLTKMPDKIEYIPEDPAEELVIELKKADKINFFIGMAKNYSYQKLDIPYKPEFKFELIEKLQNILINIGKEVCATYY